MKHARLFCFFIMCFLGLQAQEKTQQQRNLEERKEELLREIDQMERLLQEQVKRKGSAIDQIRMLDNKRYALESLIEVSANEVQILQRQIELSKNERESLAKEIQAVKKDYERVLVNSHRRKLEKNKWLFLLAAEDFRDARRRWNYMLQYASYRSAQAERLSEKKLKYEEIEKQLDQQLNLKEQKVAENRAQQALLVSDRKRQEELIKSARTREADYRKELSQREKERRRIDKEIDRLIKEAIERANRARIAAEKKKASASKSSGNNEFMLTPEAAALAKSFEGNMGRHIWPVEKGVKSIGYGTYADKLYPALKHFNNGVVIATDPGMLARAIYEGEVMSIMISRQGIKGVYVRHGDYITMYYNLEEVKVKEGDQIKAKQPLGKIHTDKVSQQTELKFYIYKNTTRLNPEEWVYKL